MFVFVSGKAMSMYILEQQKRTPEGCVHVGYMMRVFKTDNQAASYYNKHHIGYKKMRSYPAEKTSDWCPILGDRYLIRAYNDEHLTLPVFEEVTTHPFYFDESKENKAKLKQDTDSSSEEVPKKKIQKKAPCKKKAKMSSSSEDSEDSD